MKSRYSYIENGERKTITERKGWEPRVIQYLDQLALRLLNEQPPDRSQFDAWSYLQDPDAYDSREADELANRLYSAARSDPASKGHVVHWYDAQGMRSREQLDDDKFIRMCENAARYALDRWNPHFTKKLSEWGRDGGKKSKRPKLTTWEALLPIAHLSKVEQAKLLGVSVSKVANLRREMAAAKESPE